MLLKQKENNRIVVKGGIFMTQQKEYDIVCENIRHLRKAHSLSRTVMARRLHITGKTLDLLTCRLSREGG